MAAPVWVLSVDLQAKTATFQSGMSEAAKSARGSFTEIKSGSSEMGGHVNTNMFAARHSVMALSEAFGGQLPRAITAFISHIGPLGALLEAAFPFAAIALGAVLLIEHLSKLHEEGIKLTEDQVKFGTAVQLAFNQLDQKLLSAGIRADELRNDHLGALHLQLQLIDKQSMAELVHSFGEVAKAADTVFDDMKTKWYQFGIGSEGAKHALTDFQNKYDSLLAQGKDKEASDLLAGTKASAERVLALQKQISDHPASKGGGQRTGASLAEAAAWNELQKAGVGITQKEIQSQQTLVDALNAQVGIEGKINALKVADKGNATTTTGKEMSALRAEGQKQAAEHAQKMGELSLQIEREQANESNAITEASITERLMSDLHLANEEYAIQEAGNAQKIAALDKSGKDYSNQLRGLQDKAEEMTLQHTATVAGILSKSREASARLDLQNLQASEREQIEATDQGSQERLAAIDAALNAERAKGLEATTFYRDLVKQRIQAQKQADDEAVKLAAEAGKEQAGHDQKMGELALAAARENIALINSARRVSIAEQVAIETDAARQDLAIKMRAMQDDAAALDKGAKDYENKLKAIQDKETQLVQEHENQITAIKDKAMIDRNTKILAGEERYESAIAQGLTEVLMGHKSFASMMQGLSDQILSGLMQAAIKHIEVNMMTKQSDAAKAARAGFNAGMELPFPANIIAGPLLGAGAYAAVMAFEGGGVVPGIGTGDTVPAMLTPGEGVVPGSVMDGLSRMARSGEMGGSSAIHVHHSPVYHVNTIDGDGIRDTLTKHSDEFARHVQGEIRKLNR